MSEKYISESEDWFAPDTTDEHRNAAIDIDFEERLKKDPELANADPEKIEKVRTAHRRLIEEAALKSEHNPFKQRAIDAQRAADYGGLAYNTGAAGARSHEQAVERGFMVNDLNADGTLDDDAYARFPKLWQLQDAAPITKEAKRLAADMAEWNKRTEQSGFIGDVAATAKLGWDIVTNPKAIIGVGAESLSSVSAIGAGSLVGAKAGGAIGTMVAGPAGTAVGATTGAVVGRIAAGGADAATHKLSQKLREEMEAAGYELTETNLKVFVEKNPEKIKQIQKDSVKYGGVLGVVDAILGGFGARLATLPTRAARAEAMRSIDDGTRAMLSAVAKEEGISVTKLIDNHVAKKTKELLDARSFKAKLGAKVQGYGAEVASEPISEAAATASIGEEVKADDLIYETLGGIGTGPIMASINTATMGTKVAGTGAKEATKASAKKTKDFVQKIKTSTPESKAAAKKQKEAIKAARNLKNKDADVNFKKDVAEVTTPDDPRIDEWGDVSNQETYDPIKAVEALSKFDDTDSLDKARKIHNDIRPKQLELNERAEALTEKIDAGKATQQDVDMRNKIFAEVEQLEGVRKKVLARVKKMKAKAEAAAQKKEVKPINTETATPEEVTDHITDSFGSAPESNRRIKQLEKLSKNKNLDDVTRNLVNAEREAAQAQSDLSAVIGQSKTMQEVSDDIYHGQAGSEFKGIAGYRQAISNNLDKGVNNVDGALKQLDELKKFRDKHQHKSDVITAVYESKRNNTPLTEAQQKEYKTLQKEYARAARERGRKGELNIHRGSTPMVSVIQAEAAALNKEVAAAESLIRARSPQTKVSTSTPTQKSPESQPAAPVQTEQRTASSPTYDYSGYSDTSVRNLIKRGEALEKSSKITPEQEVKLKVARAELAKREKKEKERLVSNAKKHAQNLIKANATESQINKAFIQIQNKYGDRFDGAVTKAFETELNKTQPKKENVKPVQETKEESTPLPITDTVIEDAVSKETKDPGTLEIEFTDIDGETITKSYDEAVAELDQEIIEINQILKCINQAG